MDDKFQNQKKEYRKIFLQCACEIFEYLNSIKPQDFSGDIFAKYPKNSEGKIWQNCVLEFIDNIFLKDINEMRLFITKEREKYKCSQCGSCCKFACSEYSFEELQEKSKSDFTSKEFIETFEQYKTKEEALKVFPKYIELLDTNNLTDYYIYHCPKVTPENKCPQYDKRPKICADFPDNPLTFLPEKCAYNPWREKTYKVLLEIMARLEIAEFYKTNIKGYTKNENIIRIKPQ